MEKKEKGKDILGVTMVCSRMAGMTRRCRVLRHKAVVGQLFEEFSSFYTTRVSTYVAEVETHFLVVPFQTTNLLGKNYNMKKVFGNGPNLTLLSKRSDNYDVF